MSIKDKALFLILMLIILYFLFSSKLGNYITLIGNIYRNAKILLFIIPIIILYFNNDMIDIVMDYLTYFDNTGLFNSKKDLVQQLNKFSKSDINIYNKNNKTNNKTYSRNVTESKKKYVASNQSWTCKHCNNMLDATYEIDHITPIYKGGSNNLNNLQALCRNCHGKKTLYDKMQ